MVFSSFLGRLLSCIIFCKIFIGLQRPIGLTVGARLEPASSELPQPHMVAQTCPPMMTSVLMRFFCDAHTSCILLYFIWIESLVNASCFINILLFSDQSPTLENLIKQRANGPADLLAFLIHISPISCPAHRFSSVWFCGSYSCYF